MNSEKVKKGIQTTFDEVASRYDSSRFFRLSAQKMVGMLALKEGMRVLDISTGTGMVAIEMAKQHPTIKIDAIDLSAEMLSQAKAKADQEGLKNITFVQGDVEALPYEDGMFDFITCGYGMFFYPEMEATYQMLCQKLKEGGGIIFSSFTQEAFNPYVTLFLQRLENDYQIEIPKISMERLKTVSQMQSLAELSHPQEIDIQQLAIRYPVTVEQWWDMLNSAGYKGLINRLDSTQLPQFKKKHLAEVDALAVNGTFELKADTLFGLVRL